MIKKRNKKPHDWQSAVRHLKANDPILSKLVNKHRSETYLISANSIFITLTFVIVELHKNLKQFRLIREINLRDVQVTFYNHWSEPHNAELVIKGSKDFDDLTEVEKYRFENYFETRLKMIAFALNAGKAEENEETLF